MASHGETGALAGMDSEFGPIPSSFLSTQPVHMTYEVQDYARKEDICPILKSITSVPTLTPFSIIIMDLLIYLCSYTFFFLSFLCMLFLLRTSSCHFTSQYSLTLLITNQTSFRVPEISLKSKDKKETKQELEKRKNTLLDNDLGKQKEIQKANFYILNTQEILH